ncbi:integrase core domain-containing protein, partial [Achromobacter marplatensis]|uniref:integrase core domain-containing protein n=1 Tax=Achromobacter marplatensis TaxID=470868 RepID=UPI0039F68648
HEPVCYPVRRTVYCGAGITTFKTPRTQKYGQARRQHYNTVRPHSSLGYLTPQQATQVAASELLTEAKFQIPLV